MCPDNIGVSRSRVLRPAYAEVRLGPLFREIFLTLTLVFDSFSKPLGVRVRGLLILKYLSTKWVQILFNRVFLVDVPKRERSSS